MSAVHNRANPDTASAAGFVQDLAEAARDNPISTALISVGALWLFMGGSRISIFGDAQNMGGAVVSKVAASLSSVGTPVSQTATPGFAAMREQVASLGTAGGETLSASTSRVREVTGAIGDGIKTAGDLASQTGASITDMAGATPQRARELVMPFQNRLADTLGSSATHPWSARPCCWRKPGGGVAAPRGRRRNVRRSWRKAEGAGERRVLRARRESRRHD